MLLGLVLIVAALMMYFQFISPAYDASQKVKSEQLGHSILLREEQAAIKKVQDLISVYQTQGEVQEALSLALPADEDVAGALAQVYGIAKNTGLQFQSASISLRGTQAGSSGAARFSLQKPIGAISIVLQLSGSYEGFKEFLGLLENNLRIFDVGNITVSPGSAGGGRPPGLYGFNLSVTTYYQVNQ